jgi:cytoskeletal protein RodZ
MNDIGKSIRKERIARSIDIKDIANTLNIKKSLITAIEEGQVEKFASKSYYLGYTKQYINFLGLDTIKYKLESLSDHQKLEISIPKSEKFDPSPIFVVIATMLVITFYYLCSNLINKFL